MYDIKSMDENEIAELLCGMGQPKYRASQIYKWVADGVESFDEMSNIPVSLRNLLKEKCYIYCPEVLARQVSVDGTVKFLWGLRDGNSVESVVMRYRHGNTVCISTQVGCRMGCRFCASTRGGLVRNLEPGEMLDQVRYSGKAADVKISNVVLMGIGEPLENFENVMKFLKLVNSDAGLNIGMRHISISTCGPEGGIEKLADRDLQITLSVSLHAPDDETRSKIMPVNRNTGVEKLVEDCRRYYERTGRRISFEYLMADGINDSDQHARKLAILLMGMGAHVNLIPLNRIEGSEFVPSSGERVKSFIEILEKNGINVTVRRRMGADIDAACGQLRRRKTTEKEDG